MKSAVHSYIRGYARAFAVTGPKTLLVDAGTGAGSNRVWRGLGALGVQAGDVSLIVITHAHPDHVGMLPELKERTGAPVVGHAIASEAMARGEGEPAVPRTAFARLALRLMPTPRAEERRRFLTDLRIDSELDLSPYGIAGTVLPTPGHTAGSVSVVLDSGEAIVGDLVMALGPGGPGLPILAEDLAAVIASLEDLLSRGVHTFYLAHGGAVHRDRIEQIVRKARR